MGFIPSAGIENEAAIFAQLLAPETITMGQWADMHRASELTPEKGLLLAVLEDALYVVQKGVTLRSSRKALGEYADALNWLLGIDEIDGSLAFSCEDICDVLNINIGRLREAVNSGVMTGRKHRRAKNAACRPTKIAAYKHQPRQMAWV